ncbi:exopolyphosphatase [Marinicella sp. W31]|uniref:Ppx/GppA phosphatase family protein n=1 Tax=Marinicella sp. W31 TaxID=3023713 RepID=UPI003756595F
MPISKRQLYAAIDLGSNSFHMLVAAIKAQQLYPVDKVKHMVRLAAGLDEHKNITPEAMEIAFECLRTFAQRLVDIPNERIKVVGTNTLRVAKNSAVFIEQAEKILNLPIEIISGREEARTLYLGVSHSIPNDPYNRLVIDIGGGSTELIVGNRFKPILKESLFMGCVSVTKRFFADGKINKKNWQAAITYAQQQITPILQNYRMADWKNCIGASGTFRATAEILAANNMGLAGITPANLEQLIEKCFEYGSMDALANMPGLSQRRHDVYIGGLAIIAALFESFEITSVFIANGALREGLIYEMDGRLEHTDVRGRSVQKIASQFDADILQVDRVQSMAEKMTARIKEEAGLSDLQLELLNHAIHLHEIGLSIAHSQYQKHGAYIVRHADMPGFSRQHQIYISILVRQHRRKLSRSVMADLTKRSQTGLLPLIAVIRLAVIFCRDRRPHNVPIKILLWKDQQLTLSFEGDWLQRHPLIQADLLEEAGKLKYLDIDLKLE